MNDDELAAAVKASVTDVHMSIPAEQIIGRGHAIRNRRRMPGLAAAIGVVGAAAFAVAAQLPDHSASPNTGIQLTAWTVVRHGDGTVYVTIRELRDPAGLQRKLRADGVPANVIFGNPANAASNQCQSYNDDSDLMSKIVTPSTAPGQPRGHTIVMAIHPSALPGGAGVQIITDLSSVGFHLVLTSQGCTGS